MAGGTVTGLAMVGNGAVHAALANGRVITANSTADTLSATLASAPQSFPVTTITLPGGSKPVFVLPVSSNIFVAFNNTGQVGIVNGSTLTFSNAIDLGGTNKLPVAMAATPDGKKLYVANSGDGSISVIDTTSLSVIKSITFAPSCTNPAWMTANPAGGLVYVVCSSSNVVHLIDTTNDVQALANGIPVGTNPVFSIFDAKNNRLAVANSNSASVTIVNEDPNAGAALHTSMSVPVAANPVWVAVLPDGTRTYVAAKSGVVTVIDNATNTVKTNVTVGGAPSFIAASSDSLRIAVTPTAGPGANNLSSISAASETVTSQVAVTGTPSYLLVNP
jgi:YVTN family beta-propeller protein